MAGAYYEKIARINLTTGKIKVEPLDLDLAHKFIGAVVLAPRCSMTRALPPSIPCPRKTS